MEVRRQGPRGWPLHGESLTEKGSGGGDGALLGRGSLTGACGHSAGGGGQRGIRAEREQLELGDRGALAGGAERLPCGERHLPPTGRGLSVPSRHPLLPAQPSGLPGGAGCSCQSGEEGIAACSLICGIDADDGFVFILQIRDVAGLLGLET